MALLVLVRVEEGARDEVGSYHELTHITVDLYYAIGQEGFIMNNPFITDNFTGQNVGVAVPKKLLFLMCLKMN